MQYQQGHYLEYLMLEEDYVRSIGVIKDEKE